MYQYLLRGSASLRGGGEGPGNLAVVTSGQDIAAIRRQLGRPPRGVRGVAHRCGCGLPDVVRTAARLEDGTPFPTLYYLTCPRAASAIGRLEASGLMRRMSERLHEDPALREAYAAAHRAYKADRDALAASDGQEPLPATMQSAGGMPERVKCLHALVAHELARPGTNPFGAEALELLDDWGAAGPCVAPDGHDAADGEPGGARAQTAPSDGRTATTPGGPRGHGRRR